jgi:hypothetical protein
MIPIDADTTTIIIGTFGEDRWRRLAQARAIPSARATKAKVIHVHSGTIHDARNEALSLVRTPWTIHLDADDELEPNYLLGSSATCAGDVRPPMVRYMTRGRIAQPRMMQVAGHAHECVGECLTQGNWIVVGAAIKTELAQSIAWRDFPWSEDWDFWLQAYLAGGTIVPARHAIYRAHVMPGSRNRSASHEMKLAAHRAIEAANGLGPGGVRLG